MKSRTRAVNCKRKQVIVIDGKRHEIRIKENKSAWVKLKEYINSLPTGIIFTRKQLLNNIYNVDLTYTDTTIDYYKGYLNTLGFISTEKPGVYIKECDVPMHLTIKKVQAASKSIKTWQGWFIPVHERLGIDEDLAPKAK